MDHYQGNPAEILLILRDGKADDVHSIRAALGLRAPAYLNSTLDDLLRAGLIQTEPPQPENWFAAKIRVSPHLESVQHALGLSLRHLAAASPDSVFVTPFFGKPPAVQEPIDVFVLMPFSEQLRPVYEDHISKVAKQLNIRARRADDFFNTNHVMADVWQAIWGARAIVADCTGRNPNVFYEIGVAHTIGRPVILITQKRDDVPFDLQAIRYVQYEFTPRGMLDFERRLGETLCTVLMPHTGASVYRNYLAALEGSGSV